MEPHSHSFLSHHGSCRLPQTLVLLLKTSLAGPSDRPDSVAQIDLSFCQSIRRSVVNLVGLLNPLDRRGEGSFLTLVGMVKLTALCGIGSALWIWSKRNRKGKTPASSDGSTHAAEAFDVDTDATDPGLLKKHSTIREFTIESTGFTYPGIRTFYRAHPQEQKLPQEPRPVPLLVFIHGLGGSAAQFNPILISLSNLASCLAIDLPGCGRSSFAPTAWEAYTTDALVQLLAVVIEAHRDRNGDQQVVLIGHSMGCSLAAMLASPSSPYEHLVSTHVSGLIAICPKADPPTKKQTGQLKIIAALPGFMFDLIRRWDRRGGLNSVSVARMAGYEADNETKRLQLRYNKQSRSQVWQRMARGMCPNYSTGSPEGGLPGCEVWAGLNIPVFLAAGAADQTTPVINVRRILEFLGRDVTGIEPPSDKASLPIAAASIDLAKADPGILERKHQDSGVDPGDLPDMDDNTTGHASSSHYSQDQASVHTMAMSSTGESSINITTGTDAVYATPSKPAPCTRRLVVKTAIMPKPAAHSLLFAPASSRIISGLIGSFLADHIDPRLSLAWQLQYLSTEGKWDVKNFKKWQAVQPVSQPIAGIFRAMKTLREVDEEHSPKIFVKQWATKLHAVVDISLDSPVYDPKGLEAGGISYHKFPTVSKQPPTKDEVCNFIELIDKIRSDMQDGDQPLIGVHCHYGFNRTGFFLVSYLIEKEGYKVQDAIDTFQRARAPGIRHNHFIDELHVRYFPGLKKARTL
ncbi:hypothetical protein PMIN03_002959 [Paraphaeosphaeria minitans]